MTSFNHSREISCKHKRVWGRNPCAASLHQITGAILATLVLLFSTSNNAIGEHPKDLTGSGTHKYANSDRYEGEFKAGKRHGKGILVSANGDRYEGDWKDDARTGKANKTYMRGELSRYQGDWLNGKWHGRGTLIYKNGDRYEGEFKADRRHGIGVLVSANGDQYAGDWKNDTRTGRGNKTYARGDFSRYEGDWVNGKWHGYGVLTDNIGSRYEGHFKEDKKHGEGVFVSKTGYRYRERWKQGLQIVSTSETYAPTPETPAPAPETPAPTPETPAPTPVIIHKCDVTDWSWEYSFEGALLIKGKTSCSEGVFHIRARWHWEGNKKFAGVGTTFITDNAFTAHIAITEEKPVDRPSLSITHKYRKSLFE